MERMTQTAKRAWTVMIYAMADEPHLRKPADEMLQQLNALRVSPRIKAVVQITHSSQTSHPIRRYDFETKPSGSRVEDRLNHLQFVPVRDVSPRDNLSSFIRWAKRQFPARRYGLILQGHAWGVDFSIPTINAGKGEIRTQHPLFRLVLGSPRSHNRLSNKDLETALRRGIAPRKFELLGMDSCLMGMAEICYQLRNCAEYLIASEGLASIRGWPIDRILSKLNAKPEIDGESLGRAVLDLCARKFEHFEPRMKMTTSLYALKKCPTLRTAARRLASALLAGLADPPSRRAMIEARTHSDHYTIPSYVDLYDFCRRLRAEIGRSSSTRLSRACSDVMDVIRHSFVLKSVLRRGRSHSHGLSIYFPDWQIGNRVAFRFRAVPHQGYHYIVATPSTVPAAMMRIAAAYAAHDFATSTGWERFLIAFIEDRRVRH